MSKEKMPDDLMDEITNRIIQSNKEGKTSADNSSNEPTKAAKGSEAPTIADNVELVRITARISKQHRDQLEAIALRDGRLLSELVREAVREFLKR